MRDTKVDSEAKSDSQPSAVYRAFPGSIVLGQGSPSQPGALYRAVVKPQGISPVGLPRSLLRQCRRDCVQFLAQFFVTDARQK